MHSALRALSALGLALGLATPHLSGQSTTTADGRPLYLFAAEAFGIDPEQITYSRDIAPILQRSCVNCHRSGGGAPMSLTNYNEVRPWANRIRERTAIRDRRGTMPPWFVEKDVGIQVFKDDISLSGLMVCPVAASDDCL